MDKFTHPDYRLIHARGIKSLYALHDTHLHLAHYYNDKTLSTVNRIDVMDEDHYEDYLFLSARADQDGEHLKLMPFDTQFLKTYEIKLLVPVLYDLLKVKESAPLVVAPHLVLMPSEQDYFLRTHQKFIETIAAINTERGHPADQPAIAKQLFTPPPPRPL